MQRFSIRISAMHPSPLKTTGNDKTIYLVMLASLASKTLGKCIENTRKWLKSNKLRGWRARERRSEKEGNLSLYRTSPHPKYTRSIVQIEPTISDAARWQEILSTRAVAQKSNSTANKLVVSRSVYPRRVLYIFAPGRSSIRRIIRMLIFVSSFDDVTQKKTCYEYPSVRIYVSA